MNLTVELHAKQSVAFESEATELLYGGAAGGGKSFWLRVELLSWMTQVPGVQCYLFRRTYPELVQNHLEGPSGFLSLLAPWTKTRVAKVNLTDLTIEFPATGSKTYLCHCQHEKDVYRYQGSEIHVLAFDELTHFTRPIYTFLRGRVRLGGLQVPPHLASRLPRIIAGTNPGGVGHNWVRSEWIDPAPPFAAWRAPDESGGMLRQFIPALLEDNPTLQSNDPNYRKRLEGLDNPALVRAMLEGSWDIVAGGALDDVWSLGRHVVPHFAIPRGWSLDRSFDWGSSKPFSVGWWAESNGEPADIGGERRHFPKGTLFRIAELYGWNGRANEGCRKTASEIAREVLAAEKAMGFAGRVQPGPADPAIFAVENGT
ncbi:MAG: terminase family protein, partial [Rhodocyclaceae bacterium]|nr:terminase family protein [Rhodocyclaceae bacterium]